MNFPFEIEARRAPNSGHRGATVKLRSRVVGHRQRVSLEPPEQAQQPIQNGQRMGRAAGDEEVDRDH